MMAMSWDLLLVLKWGNQLAVEKDTMKAGWMGCCWESLMVA